VTPWPQTGLSQETRGDVKKIVAAWNEAVKFAAENPKEADAIMAKFTGQKPEEFTKEKTGVRSMVQRRIKIILERPKNPAFFIP